MNNNSLKFILDECIECRLCVEECPFLSKYSLTPKDIVRRLLGGINQNKRYIMECLLCGLCRSVCPKNLDFPSVISYARQLFSKNIIDEIYYRLFMPDDPLFFPKAYKTYKGINYSIPENGSFEYIFFPGCSMSSYSPEAVKKIYWKLVEKLCNVGFTDLCCGKPLADIGLIEGSSKWLLKLENYFTKHECRNIIVACPMCYYHLKHSLPNIYKILTIYEIMGETFTEEMSISDLKVTIHDSCPDRSEGIFATEVRNLLKNYKIIEMKHSREKSLCCGAGGMASIADPNLTLNLSSKRAEEFYSTGADLMVVYCYTCAQIFWSTQPSIQTKHVLDLVLGTRDSSEDIKSGEVGNLIAKFLMEHI
ncbi:MAG: (Fe-S)-binding protein [Candidatus Bathyarchaeia archaeon]|nr:(Fe-S)-binding protein [Candidatus Bathyarchaeota archaeon]